MKLTHLAGRRKLFPAYQPLCVDVIVVSRAIISISIALATLICKAAKNNNNNNNKTKQTQNTHKKTRGSLLPQQNHT